MAALIARKELYQLTVRTKKHGQTVVGLPVRLLGICVYYRQALSLAIMLSLEVAPVMRSTS